MPSYINDVYYYALQSKARVLALYGGRDSGKSYFVGGQYIPLALEQEDYFRGLVVRKTYASHRDSTHQEIIDGISDLGLEGYSHIKSPLFISSEDGLNTVIFRGLDEPKKIKSIKGINCIWVEEAEDLTRRTYDDLLMLLRGPGYQRLIMTFNPVDESHFSNRDFAQAKKDRVYEYFEDGRPRVWEIDVAEEIEGERIEYTVLVICSTYTDNAFISPHRKLIIEKLKEHDPELYDVYRHGKYGRTGGTILRNWQEVDFEADEIVFENFDNRGYVQDFGYNHANCILTIAEKDNCLYIFDEIYVHEKTTESIIEMANEADYDKNIVMICDSADPGRIQTWVDNGYYASGVEKYAGSVYDQIMTLKSYSAIYINSKCKWTLKEIKAWKWKQRRDGTYEDKIPVDVFDDAMACLRYSKDLFSGGDFWHV